MNSVVPVAAPRVSSRPVPAERRFEDADQIGDEAAREAVRAVLGRQPGIPSPAVPLELRTLDPTLDADVDFGWPTLKVLGYFESEQAAADVMEAQGWAVFQIERGVTADELEKALLVALERAEGEG